MTLTGFIAYLSSEEMIDATKLKDDDDWGFENRLKTQKYVYFAQYYGLDLGYHYNFHLHGPYSTDLTKAYYGLELDEIASAPIPSGLDRQKFLADLKGKSAEWLEIAATILFEKKNNNEEPKIEHVYDMKPDHNPKVIDSVYGDLRSLTVY